MSMPEICLYIEAQNIHLGIRPILQYIVSTSLYIMRERVSNISKHIS